jgi:hypothetical protein
MPKTTQQAQDAVYQYYQKTLISLPNGYALDNSRYGGKGAKGGSGVNVVACNDNADPNTTPARYSDSRVVVAPPGTNYTALIARLGEIWRSWGWKVEERDGFDKPNRFGSAPDGYELIIEPSARDAENRPPTLTGVSPCFPGDKTRYEPIPDPHLVTKDKLDYDEPSESAEPDRPRNFYNW